MIGPFPAVAASAADLVEDEPRLEPHPGQIDTGRRRPRDEQRAGVLELERVTGEPESVGDRDELLFSAVIAFHTS